MDMVAIAGILAGTGISCFFIHSIKVMVTNRGRRSDQVVLDEVRALRAELQELRRENHSLILALDDTRVPPSLKRAAQPELPEELIVGRR